MGVLFPAAAPRGGHSEPSLDSWKLVPGGHLDLGTQPERCLAVTTTYAHLAAISISN